jgi:hypothetical protein
MRGCPNGIPASADSTIPASGPIPPLGTRIFPLVVGTAGMNLAHVLGHIMLVRSPGSTRRSTKWVLVPTTTRADHHCSDAMPSPATSHMALWVW